MYYKVLIELHINPENYDDDFDMEQIVISDLEWLIVSDIMSACEVIEVNS